MLCFRLPLRSRVAECGMGRQPVAVGIEADQKAFQFYGGGVLPAKKCGVKLDHGVLAVRRPRSAPCTSAAH